MKEEKKKIIEEIITDVFRNVSDYDLEGMVIDGAFIKPSAELTMKLIDNLVNDLVTEHLEEHDSFYDFEFWVGHNADFDFDYGEVKRVMEKYKESFKLDNSYKVKVGLTK